MSNELADKLLRLVEAYRLTDGIGDTITLADCVNENIEAITTALRAQEARDAE